MTQRKAWAFLACVLLFGPVAHAAPGTVQVPAIILKVEGEGIANVRKRTGIIESAGARGKVYPGDKILTDAHSAVYLMLTDGTVVKVGFNTEFLVEGVENKGHYLSWFFRLTKGVIRAMVEKIPANETHLRVESPTGTVGVRGTEFVFEYDENTGSNLYMLEGLVSFGAAGCEKTRTCIDVKGGEATAVLKGKTAPEKPRPLDVKELFGISAQAAPAATTESRLSVFRDARRVGKAQQLSSDEATLKKLVSDAATELATAQDRAIGRTKAEREAMNAAMKGGTYNGVVATADAYAQAKKIFTADSNGGAENLVAQTAAAKFRLGQAVQAADKAGAFSDKDDGTLGDRTFTDRKNLDYDQSAEGKAKQLALQQASDDYRDTLEYAEAISAADLADPTKEDGEHPPEPPHRHKCDMDCMMERVDHETDVASEGVSNAFANVKMAESDKVHPRKGGHAFGHFKSRYFERTVNGDSCFAVQKTNCHLTPCQNVVKVGPHGQKCTSGQVMQCEQKQVPVRCSDAR
jgi:hypothetical protein